MALLPVDEAQRRLLGLGQPLPIEAVPLVSSAGLVLATDLAAQRNQPSCDVSAMDGYAVRAADGAGPWRVAGVSSAGMAPQEAPLEAGCAVRIFTGAPLPPGADTVLLQEDMVGQADMIRQTRAEALVPGRHVRPAGSDFSGGEVLLAAGTRIGAREIGLAALSGHGSLSLRRRPKIAILSTGDELVLPGAIAGPGQIPASNGLMLSAMIAQAGAELLWERIVGDDLDATIAALRDTASADIIVTSGGASVGDHDLVRPAVEAAGGTIDFWKIRMRPGKPLIAGRIGDAVLLGLPGNPVSAFVTGTLFLQPLIRHLMGAPDPFPAVTKRQLALAVGPGGERDDYMRATLDANGAVRPISRQDSAHLAALCRADCLLIRPAGAPPAQAGEDVPVILLG